MRGGSEEELASKCLCLLPLSPTMGGTVAWWHHVACLKEDVGDQESSCADFGREASMVTLPYTHFPSLLASVLLASLLPSWDFSSLAEKSPLGLVFQAIGAERELSPKLSKYPMGFCLKYEHLTRAEERPLLSGVPDRCSSRKPFIRQMRGPDAH